MATAPQVQTLAVMEARSLFRLVGKNDDTVEKIGELIAVPPTIEAVLRAYAARYPEDGASVGRALEFRRRVGEEFERLVQGMWAVHGRKQIAWEGPPR